MSMYRCMLALPATLLSLGWILLPAHAGETAPASPVVVELFTSQGCSSCPPADAYLGKLAGRPGILALGFHIDYWNYIGWTDPYSLPEAAQRQRDYARRLGLHYVYTPQMVIDGRVEGVGSEPVKIEPLLHAATRAARTGPAVMLERHGQAGFHIHVGAGTAPGAVTLWLVGFDHEHATKVLQGENEGETARDYQIVRSMRAVGTWNGTPLDLDVAAGSARGDHAALLLQIDGTGPIVAATALAEPAS
ncbi:MAG TPA: DUF1223 domain-containing protein [Stellaceae bacterium]